MPKTLTKTKNQLTTTLPLMIWEAQPSTFDLLRCVSYFETTPYRPLIIWEALLHYRSARLIWPPMGRIPSNANKHQANQNSTIPTSPAKLTAINTIFDTELHPNHNRTPPQHQHQLHHNSERNFWLRLFQSRKPTGLIGATFFLINAPTALASPNLQDILGRGLWLGRP